VLALSTDKAANPINLYGASKLAADKIFVAANNLTGGDGPQFSVVRYGNVIGSRGSVVPYFQKLIRDKAPAIPITHRQMTRFWITLDQGIEFVLQSITRMKGGEIFVPKIPSMSIVDVASALAPGTPQVVVGIRPGEKLHEALTTEDDARSTVDLGDCYVITPSIRFSSFGDYGDSPKVAEGFTYTSDRNPQKLSISGFLQLMSNEGF
jgi:UDP-N-acetylglucosamine 4,6-dehydratase